MKKTVTIDVCDYCEAELSSETHTMALVLGAKQFTSALCQGCLDDIEVELKQVLGKALTDTTPGKAKRKSKDFHSCPYCGKVLNSEQGVKIHVGQSHKQ